MSTNTCNVKLPETFDMAWVKIGKVLKLLKHLTRHGLKYNWCRTNRSIG